MSQYRGMKSGAAATWMLAVAILLANMSVRLVSSPASDAERTREIAKGREKSLGELRNILEQAETFTLFSLNPERASKTEQAEEFKGYTRLGKTQIHKGAERTNLVAALYEGIANGNAIASCFNPRHGIRATQGSNTVELLVCFECGQVYTFSSQGTNQMFATSEKPAATFNASLTKAGVSLSRR